MIKRILLTCLLLCALPAHADNKFAINLHAGFTQPIENDYSPESPTLGLSIGAKTPHWLFRAGYTDFDKFNNNKYDEGLKIRSTSINAKLDYKIFTKFFDFYVGGGIHRTNTHTDFYGYRLQEETGVSPSLDIILSKNLVRFFALQLETQYIFDVSGSDLATIGVNAQFTF